MRILCLDDEPLALRMLEQAVRQSKPDADISAYLDQDELLEQTKQGGCDIAFLDIHMRGMNGVELAKKLKELNIPVLAQDTGDSYGRTVIFYPENGNYVIRAVGKPEKTI
jgi:CheY-like chemotaxis protein